jgi:predicted small lipoprotein YifL
MMTRPVVLQLVALCLALGLAACGVKTDLEPPPGAIHQKGERDPSKPPDPVGQ